MAKTKYCTTCGKKMHYKRKIYEYNSNDGSPIYVHEWRCPVRFSADEHDWETGMNFSDDGKLISVKENDNDATNARLIVAELLHLVVDLYAFWKGDYPNDITFDDRYNKAMERTDPLSKIRQDADPTDTYTFR